MDTIAAAATAAGTGAIGIVRLSGPEAHAVLRRIFVPASGKDPPERYMAYGAILDAEGRVIDRGLGVRFAAERS